MVGRDALSTMVGACRYGAKRPSCGCGIQTLLLDANGDIYPCLNLSRPELCVANVRQKGFTFSDVWSSSSVLADVRQKTAITNPQRPCCQCAFRFWCLGGCHGETLSTKGMLESNAWNCDSLKRAWGDVMWLLAAQDMEQGITSRKRSGRVKHADHC